MAFCQIFYLVDLEALTSKHPLNAGTILLEHNTLNIYITLYSLYSAMHYIQYTQYTIYSTKY